MRSRTKSHVNRTSVDAKISELEDAEDEDAGLRDERDFKRSQVRAYTTLCETSLLTGRRYSVSHRSSSSRTNLPVSSMATLGHPPSMFTPRRLQRLLLESTCLELCR